MPTDFPANNSALSPHHLAQIKCVFFVQTANIDHHPLFDLHFVHQIFVFSLTFPVCICVTVNNKCRKLFKSNQLQNVYKSGINEVQSTFCLAKKHQTNEQKIKE